MSLSKLTIDVGAIESIATSLDQPGLPGGAIGIADDGKPVICKAYGRASMDLPVLLTPHTPMRIASVSKQFTSLAYLLLCEDGRANLDDPLSRFLPELHRTTHRTTMRDLMGHVSGLRDAYCVFDRFNDAYSTPGGAAQSVTSADLLKYYESIEDVEAPPGTMYKYNNGGYLLLTAAIERITGQPMEDVLRERVFAPLNMQDTRFLRSDNRFVGNLASQHAGDPRRGYERLGWGLDNYSGGGAIVSTVDDLLLWLKHMDEPKIGSAAVWTALKTSLVLANGKSTKYGLGVQIGSHAGLSTISHTGNALGGSAQVLKIPQVGLDIVVLVNRQDVSAPVLAEKIVETCLPSRKMDEPLRGWSAATGTFYSRTSGRVIELLSSEALGPASPSAQVVRIDGLGLPFVPDRDGTLVLTWNWNVAETITLHGDRTKPSRIVYRDCGETDELVRVDKTGGNEDYQAIVGDFRAAQIDTFATIALRDGALELTTRGRFGSVRFRLEELGRGIWRADFNGVSRVQHMTGVLLFDRGSESFSFSTFGMRLLPFRRVH